MYTEVYLKPGLKPSALNLCKPPSPNVMEAYPPTLFNNRIPPLQEAQLTSSKSSHGNLVTSRLVHLTDLKIYHYIHQV